ncbi:MAG: aspartate kinase [Prevotella sp.]|nr:aspartate kinase [Prevotella sp.]
MKVMKFGGTSVGSPERIKNVAALVTKSGEQTFVVLSAMSGTTNALVEICNHLYRKEKTQANKLIDTLEEKYRNHIDELYENETWREKTHAYAREVFEYLRSFTNDIFTSYEEKNILAQGELLSTTMMTTYLTEQNIKAMLLPALDFMKTDKYGEPDQPYIGKKLTELMDTHQGYQIYVTQGFICRNAFGETDNLQRGGSDYTASLIGAALQSEEIQIWTDIDGMHNNDPRIVEKTSPVRQLSFEEAAELAFFGAKILHPTCIQPAKDSGVPVRLLNTMQPEAEGTLISQETCTGTIKAIAAKDDMTAITVHAGKGTPVSTFLKQVFDAFEHYQTPIDIACTSQGGVTLSFNDNRHRDDIVEELKNIGTVETKPDCCVICVVGDLFSQEAGYDAVILNTLRDIPVKMVSYGASEHNISLLVSMTDKKEALQRLSNTLFYHTEP